MKPERKVNKVSQALMGNKAKQARRARLVHRVLRARKDLADRRVQLVLLEQREILGLADRRVSREFRDRRAGATGPQGPAGGFGAHGSFYDTTTVTVTSSQAIPIPLNTTVFASDVSITNGHEIRFAKAGKYDIQFSSQLQNTSNAVRQVIIWLSKNGIASSSWVAESSTDLVIGKDTANERVVASWNFFVDASANDFFVLLIATNGSGVEIHAGSSLVTNPAGIPLIPSTILTVNQVG